MSTKPHIIIDRRVGTKGKSTVNRQRYVRRVKDQVREAVKDVIRDGNIKDVVDSSGKKIRIPGKGLKKPQFQHDRNGGVTDGVFPGNKEFNQGDRIDRPPSGGGGGGGGASPDGEGQDGFEFHLTQKEFLDTFFEDLELPDMVKKQIVKLEEWVWQRSGFAVDGNPSRLDIIRSMKQSKGRRFALKAPKKRKMKELQAELEKLEALDPNTLTEDQEARIGWLILEIAKLRKRLSTVPFIDDIDLRYKRWERVPIPSTQAVMFCIMDVSASMGEWEKEMAKRFFMLLYLFLVRNYERVDIIFIRHHTEAKEVDEQEFFYSRESGGTLVSTSLRLMREIIQERYSPEHWNIFCCQASDGDNWMEDNNRATQAMEALLPLMQYFAYVEIDRHGGKDSDLWPHYERLKDAFANLAMTVITDVTEIYPVFRGLFEKREKTT